MMMLNSLKIFVLWVLMGGSLLVGALPAKAAERYDPSKVEALSSMQFWGATHGIDIKGDEKEYIICGEDVCDPDVARCTVKVIQRFDHATAASALLKTMGEAQSGAGGGLLKLMGKAIEAERGVGTVTKYEYACLPKEQSLPEGWQEAPEGGVVKRVKVRTGGWLASAKTKSASCYTGNDNKQYCLWTKEKRDGSGVITKSTVNYNASGTAFRGCEVLPVKLYEARRCFHCVLFATAYRAAVKITMISFDTFASAFALLIALGLAIWIAVMLLGQVSSLTKQDAPKFLGILLKQGYKFLIAFLLLQYSSQIFTYGLQPILKAGIEFSRVFLDDEFTAFFNADKNGEIEEFNPGIAQRMASIPSNTYFPAPLYNNLDTMVMLIQRKLSFMQSVGSSLICVGGNGMRFAGNDIGFGSGFVILLQGLFLAGAGFLFALAFAFYLVDAVVQLGIAGALMPFLIACWPFKLTAKYANIGWNMFLNSVFILMVSGLVVSVSFNLVDAALSFTATEELSVSAKDNTCVDKEDCDSSQVNMGGLYKIAQAINTQDEASLKRLTDISKVGFLIMIFCGIFGFKFLGRVGELAGKFAGGALKPIAPSIATMGASFAKSAALKTTQSTREAMGRGIKRAGGAIGSLFFGSKAKNNNEPKGGNDGQTSGGDGSSGGGSGGSGGPGGGNPSSSVARSTARNGNLPQLNEGRTQSEGAEAGAKANVKNERKEQEPNKPEGEQRGATNPQKASVKQQVEQARRAGKTRDKRNRQSRKNNKGSRKNNKGSRNNRRPKSKGKLRRK